MPDQNTDCFCRKIRLRRSIQLPIPGQRCYSVIWTRRHLEFGAANCHAGGRSRPKNNKKWCFLKKRLKSSILGVDSLSTRAYKPPPLSERGQLGWTICFSLLVQALFEKVGSILEEIRGRRYVITCRSLWFIKVSLLNFINANFEQKLTNMD